MDVERLRTLLQPDSLALLDALGPLDSKADVARTVTSLRAAGHSPALVAAVVDQALLRGRAGEKFGPFASRMLFTAAGLEQATRLSVAGRHAARFRAAGATTVADLGCGIGGDALALAALGIHVRAVDADEVTAAIASFNLAPFGPDARVARGRAEDAPLEGVDAVWLDPARRSGGRVRLAPEEWSPPLDWVFALGARLPAGIKLSPAFHREGIPAGSPGSPVEAQWITVGTTTIELVVWTGALARAEIGRAALVLKPDADGTLTGAELAAPGAADDEPVRQIGEYLHEPAGAVIRAELVGEVARALDAGPVASGIAYLTGDSSTTSPFAQSFRVREVLPADTRSLARALRRRDIGTLEIKKRGVDLDPAALRTTLKLRGDAAATLLIMPIAGKRVAVLAERV